LFTGKSALAVPTASEAATAMETPETTTHAVRETATPEMGDTYAAAHAVVQATHTTAEAMIAAAVVRMPAIKYGGVAVITVILPA
jgi:hypothetical protein